VPGPSNLFKLNYVAMNNNNNNNQDEEARKAADLGPADGAQRGRISFEVVKGLIRSQVKHRPPNHAPTLR
jgi:hypothetical protein